MSNTTARCVGSALSKIQKGSNHEYLGEDTVGRYHHADSAARRILVIEGRDIVHRVDVPELDDEGKCIDFYDFFISWMWDVLENVGWEQAAFVPRHEPVFTREVGE